MQLVLDNGLQFVSDEFKQFIAANRITHIKTSPYHPASNGAVERMVHTLKLTLKAVIVLLVWLYSVMRPSPFDICRLGFWISTSYY